MATKVKSSTKATKSKKSTIKKAAYHKKLSNWTNK